MFFDHSVTAENPTELKSSRKRQSTSSKGSSSSSQFLVITEKSHEYTNPVLNMFLEPPSNPEITSKGIATNSKPLVNRPGFSTQEGFISTKQMSTKSETRRKNSNK